MKVVIRNFALLVTCLIVLGWLAAPYLTQATERAKFSISDKLGVVAGTQGNDFRQARGTVGYWRLIQDSSGVWWFYSPQGKKEFLNTVTTVQPVQFGLRPTDPHFISRDAQGSADNSGCATRDTLGRKCDVGFKGLAAWCNPAFSSA